MAYKNKSDTFKYNNEFNKRAYDRISLFVPKGKKELIQAKAKENNESINSFINRAIELLSSKNIESKRCIKVSWKNIYNSSEEDIKHTPITKDGKCIGVVVGATADSITGIIWADILPELNVTDNTTVGFEIEGV